jgi:dinuclear metal center YbgI/SA1388 family protein
MKIKEIIGYMESWAPLACQESYDNSGLQVGDPETEFLGGLVCLDVTPERVEEAAATGANLIVSHHPVLFHPLRQVCGGKLSEQIVIKAIKSGIAIYSAHTSLDNVRSGVNACLGRTLGLENTDFLQPNCSLPDAGGGIIGELEAPMEEGEILSMVKKQLRLPVLRHSRLRGKPVRRVAACGGAGGFMLQDAIRRGADAFVVGEAHYHDFIDFQDNILIVEVGHYESECLIKSEIFARLNEKFGNFAVSEKELTPYNYL